MLRTRLGRNWPDTQRAERWDALDDTDQALRLGDWISDELDRFADAHIVGGQYANASEVFRAGSRALDHQERLYEAELERVRSAIDESDAGEDAEEYSLDALLSARN